MQIRFATEADASLIHRFIMELAIYEREPDAVECTPESLAAQLRQLLEAVFFQAPMKGDEAMKLIFMCTSCAFRWLQ